MPDSFEARLRELQAAYAADLPRRIEAAEGAWRTLAGGSWDPEKAQELHRTLHGLAGSGRTFGFGRVSEEARAAETLLKGLLESGRSPDRQEMDLLVQILGRLGAAASEPGVAPTPALDGQAVRHEPALRDPRRVYLLSGDAGLARELRGQLAHFGYEVEDFSARDALESAISELQPTALMVETSGGRDHGLLPGWVADLRQRLSPDLPVLFISDQGDFDTRLAAARAGGEAYLLKPVDIAPLVDRLDRLTHHRRAASYRVMIVDDGALIAAHYALVLSSAGMVVQTVTDPRLVMEALADFGPELVLMNVYMPFCSGPELTTVIRQHDAHVGLPILFLSGEQDLARQFNAMQTGADDFLTKPIDADHLVSAVAVRVERARLLHSLMTQDALTGLLNHTKIKEQLANELSRAARESSGLVFAMIDIDHFKDVNDRYGHLSGDRVIKTLARMLREHVRQSDGVGRYGGEEFAVVLPGCDAPAAVRLLAEIQQHFADVRFVHEGEEFSVTFSAGLATYPEYGTAPDLTCAADRALYEAKRLGRRRIELAPPVLPPGG